MHDLGLEPCGLSPGLYHCDLVLGLEPSGLGLGLENVALVLNLAIFVLVST